MIHKTRYICLVMIFALSFLLAACAAPGDTSQTTTAATTEPALNASEYFPFEPDVHMKYKGTGNEFAEFETYVDFLKDGKMQLRILNPGTVSVHVYAVDNGSIKILYSEGETYFRHDFTGFENKSEILLPAVLSQSASWQTSDGATRTVTGVDVKVTVPAGEYQAVEITVENENSVLREYYVKGIGLVKRVFTTDEAPGEEITSELESIEKGVPMKQQLTVFLPDYDKGVLVQEIRNVDIFTNDMMETVFTAELKKKPENTKVIAIMSEKAEIISFDPISEENMLVVNFNSSFVSGMNAGSGVESMILDGIVETLGGYFQKDRVKLRIEGKPYSSGHFEFKEDEYLSRAVE